MKKQVPLDCSPSGACGKCPPCLAMQKLCEKQQNIPAKCTSKQRPQPKEIKLIGSIYTTRKNWDGRGDQNSDSEDSNKCHRKKDPEVASSPRKKPAGVKREESEELIYIRKPKYVESSETVYSKKPKESKHEKPFDKRQKCSKLEESDDMVYSRRPKCVKREESDENVYCKRPERVKHKESDETVYSRRPKCIKHKESDETVYSKKLKYDKHKESDEIVYNKRPKYVKREDSDETVCNIKRKESNETVSSKKPVHNKRKELDETVCTRKTNCRKVSDIKVCKQVSKNKCEEATACLKKYFGEEPRRLQPRASNTSIPDDDEYINYIPRVCVQQKQRPKSRELRAGISYIGCDCGKRNGLQDQCKRTECQGCPKCRQFPPSCYLSRYTNANHLTKLKEAGIRKRCPYMDKKGNVLIST